MGQRLAFCRPLLAIVRGRIRFPWRGGVVSGKGHGEQLTREGGPSVLVSGWLICLILAIRGLAERSLMRSGAGPSG